MTEAELIALLKAESLTPLRHPTTLTPRWRQVYHRVALHLPDDHLRRIAEVACETYLGEEVCDPSVR